jgi:ABC-type sugar transport system ATPase subunit
MTDAAVRCRDVALGYGDTAVLSGVDLTVEPDTVLALLGPSGSGKSTLLHAVAGLVVPRSGEIWLRGRMVSTARRTVPPEDRHVGMVFQNYALWPHLSVLETVAYPLRRRGISRADARRAAYEVLVRTDLAELAQRRPGELSGGQAQRVGLARALAAEPLVYLFDEPTAHLDAHLRTVVLDEVARSRAANGAAAIYATHDAAEALAIADLVGVVHDGRLVQTGTPTEVYERPADLTVARLTGPVSVVSATSQAVLVRPDWAVLDGPIPGTVATVRYRGTHTDYQVASPIGTVLIRADGPPRLAAGAATTWALRRTWSVPVSPVSR